MAAKVVPLLINKEARAQDRLDRVRQGHPLEACEEDRVMNSNRNLPLDRAFCRKGKRGISLEKLSAQLPRG